MLALSSGADSIELKLTVPEQGHRSAIEALGLDPLDAQIRLVCFFDTPDLRLNRQGVIVRARRVQGREDDSVVKLRPVVPDELPAQLRAAPEMVVELDAMPGGYVCSASMKARLKGAAGVKKRLRGKRATSKLFTKPQRRFYEQHAPAGLALDDLAVLGPIFVLKLKLDAGGLRPQTSARRCGSIPTARGSSSCRPSAARRRCSRWRPRRAGSWAGAASTCRAGQQTKTKTALQQFSKALGTG